MALRKLFELENLRKFTKNPFIIYRMNELEEQIYGYQELVEAIEFLHRQLNSLEIITPCCFAVDSDSSFEAIALLIGILNYGSHFCPVPKDASEDFLEICAASYLFSDKVSITEKFRSIEFLDAISIDKRKFSLYVIKENIKRGKLRLQPSDMCYTISTTGTTGIPKIVHVPYNCVAPNISALCQKCQLTSKDIIYLGTPPTFDPFVVELFMALATGAALLLTPSKNPLKTKNLLQILWPEENTRPAVTVLQMTPTNFRQFGLETIKQKIFALKSKLRILILGGEEFPRRHELIKWLPEQCLTHVKIFNIYGITELSCWSTIYEWNSLVEEERTPIGLPLDNDTLLRMVSTVDGRDINGPGKGELLVGSTKRKTYMPQIDNIESVENNAEILFRSSGDLVERTNKGHIFYVGRLNDIVKRRGKRICLTAIERKLDQALSRIADMRTIFLWHEGQQNLICCLKVDNANLAKEVKGMILKTLTEHEKPDRIVIIEELPLDKHNKLDRKRLLEEVLNLSISNQPLKRFQLFLDEILQFDSNIQFNSELTAKRLKSDLESDNMSKSFTSAGGSSFQALSLATQIGEFLANSNDQRMLLKMLLDANTSVSQICNFLKNVAIKENNPYEGRTSPGRIPTTARALKFTEETQLKMLWRVHMEKCIDAAPTLSQSCCNVCIGSHAGLLLNIEASSGEVLSRFRLRGRIECQVAFASSELALVGCDAGFLYGLNFLNGQLKWSLYVGDQIKAKVLVIDTSFAIVGCYNAEFNLAGVCLQKVQVRWRKKIGIKPIFAAPIMLGSCRALVCTLDGTYECLDVRTSQTIWTRKCDSPIFSTPKNINNGNKFLIAEVQGKIHLCQSENGEILQSFQCDGNIFSNLQTYQIEASILHIIFGCHDHHVYCLKLEENETTGIRMTQNWKTKLNAAVFSTPNVIEMSDSIYIIACSTRGLLVVIENSTGCIISEQNMGNEVFSSICCAENNKNIKIYFGCRDDYFYCFQYSVASE